MISVFYFVFNFFFGGIFVLEFYLGLIVNDIYFINSGSRVDSLLSGVVCG